MKSIISMHCSIPKGSKKKNNIIPTFFLFRLFQEQVAENERLSSLANNPLNLDLVKDKCSDRSMEVNLPAPVGKL